MNEWIPVTDRLPESPDFVLVTGRKASDYKHIWVGIDVYLPKEDMWSEYVDVTAWMPLPEPYSKERTITCINCAHANLHDNKGWVFCRKMKQWRKHDFYCADAKRAERKKNEID